LLNQYQVSKGFQAKAGLGNINPNLYRLYLSASNSFHDITSGSNIVPCVPNTLNCVNGSLGYSAGVGYDLVTGLGSVDGNNLVTQWSNKVVNTTTTVTANPASIGLNGSTQVTATVKAVGSASVPAGTVAFNVGNTALGSATLSGSGSATFTVFGSQLSTGNNTITAHYSGSSSFNGSSGSVTVAVSVPTANSAVIPSIVPNPVYQQEADTDGYSWFFTIRLTEVAGVATTLTDFTFNGTSVASSIVDFFGSSTIPAHGTLSADLRVRGLSVPTTVVFGFSGMDHPGGPTWSQQLSVPFYAQQTTASMALSSVPGKVRQNPNFSAICQDSGGWFQHLGLEEQNGRSVQITKFLAGGFDLSDQILDFFGSTTLPALGSLLAGVCWQDVAVPQTLTYEIDGIDDAGNKISATLSALFDAPLNSGTLSMSRSSVGISVPSTNQFKSTNINVNLPAGQQWTVSVFPSNRTTRWLVAFPQSGSGTTAVSVSADSSGLANGLYSATLVFQATDAMPQFIDVPVTFAVGPTLGALPVLAVGGVVNAASFALNKPVSPGALVSIFGNHFAASAQQASKLPLATFFNGVNVTFNGIPAPLLFVGATQINAQVPYGVTGTSADVQASTTDGYSNTITVPIAPATPGIISQSSNGSGPGVITDAITGALITAAAPIPRGGIITIYGVGNGPVSFRPGAGAAAPFSPLAQNTNTVTLSIGGITVTPLFAGLAPGFVGLNQINAVVPANAPTGSAVPVFVTASGITSNVVTMAIK
jgi:uncharacterized protein (TIGR03437 family)